jgi:hypothetical protein
MKPGSTDFFSSSEARLSYNTYVAFAFDVSLAMVAVKAACSLYVTTASGFRLGPCPLGAKKIPLYFAAPFRKAWRRRSIAKKKGKRRSLLVAWLLPEGFPEGTNKTKLPPTATLRGDLGRRGRPTSRRVRRRR